MANYTGPKYTLGGSGPKYQLGGYPPTQSVPAVENVAAATWTPANLQGLADAYSALNPGWTPPADMNAALPHPIQPVKFDPMGDVGYAATSSAVLNQNEHAQANYNYQSDSGEQNFGVDAYGNPIGGANYNPFSQAAELQRSYDNTKRGTTNSYAASGQLYSGALLNKRADDQHNYDVSDDRLKRAASDYYNTIGQNNINTQDQGALTLAGQYGPAFMNFLNSQKGY